MSENTVNAARRRLGYAHDEMTGHGFRSEASTLLNEQGWHPDLIELQLAHAERNNVRARRPSFWVVINPSRIRS
jgi:integrase